MGEDITGRGGGRRAQSALWFRPCQGGQLTTKGVAGPPKEYNLHPAMDLVLCRGEEPTSCVTRTQISGRRLDFENSVTSLGDGGVDTDGFTDPRDWRTVDGEGLKSITLHPNSLRINLVEWTLVVLFDLFLCYFMFYIFYVRWFFYGLVFAEALLWTFRRLEYVKCCRFRLFFFLKKMVLFAFCGRFIIHTLLQQGIPRDGRNV